jgi:hypothetical protein
MKKRKYPRKKRVLSLSAFLRYQIKEWRQKQIETYGTKCYITGYYRKGKIHIHHVYPVHLIRDEILIELNLQCYDKVDKYTAEELSIMAIKFAEKHNNVIGIPMLKKVHKLFHKLYGYNATWEDIQDFKSRYDSKEFSEMKFV